MKCKYNINGGSGGLNWRKNINRGGRENLIHSIVIILGIVKFGLVLQLALGLEKHADLVLVLLVLRADDHVDERCELFKFLVHDLSLTAHVHVELLVLLQDELVLVDDVGELDFVIPLVVFDLSNFIYKKLLKAVQSALLLLQ